MSYIDLLYTMQYRYNDTHDPFPPEHEVVFTPRYKARSTKKAPLPLAISRCSHAHLRESTSIWSMHAYSMVARTCPYHSELKLCAAAPGEQVLEMMRTAMRRVAGNGSNDKNYSRPGAKDIITTMGK